MLADLESDLVERKESLQGDAPNRIREAVCAFANDLPDHRRPGVIFSTRSGATAILTSMRFQYPRPALEISICGASRRNICRWPLTPPPWPKMIAASSSVSRP